MKKVILALAIVSVAFVACNNSGETKEAAKDTTPAVETPKVDTPAAPVVADTTAKAPVADTTKK
ncbi:MAG TPA: hypothetical protein PK133_11295 [Ferruginibacter sp.]|nr:hypothetical protein [Chitinophagaceae bacterium]MBP6286085.1 hypothetical protein [Ferruginibacter sp.]HQY12793.1 hypothetical protein [Ferruginibacter sp.]